MEFLILIVLGGLSWVAGLAPDRLLKRRLQSFPKDRVFIIPGFFRQPLLLVALVLIPLEIIFPLAWLLVPEDGIGIGLGLGLPALMLPLLAFALAMLWTHYGAVILTDEGIRRVYLIGQHDITYGDLREVEQKFHFLTPVTVVKGCGETFRFPRQIQDHPELFMVVKVILETNRKAMRLSYTSQEGAVDFPFAFGVSPRRLLWERIAFALLLLIFAVLATLGIWIQLGQGMIPPFTLESLFLIGLFFIPFGIIFPILVVIAYRQTIDPEKPIRFVLHRDRIEVFYPHHRQECYRVRDLESVSLKPSQSNLKSSFDGVRVSQQLTHYELIIEFLGGKTVILTPNRLSLFNQTPEGLWNNFRELYDI